MFYPSTMCTVFNFVRGKSEFINIKLILIDIFGFLEEEIATTIIYLKNHFVAIDEPFTEVVSQTKP